MIFLYGGKFSKYSRLLLPKWLHQARELNDFHEGIDWYVLSQTREIRDRHAGHIVVAFEMVISMFEDTS